MLGPSALGPLIERLAWLTLHASRGKQFFVKSFDFSFQSATIVVLTYMFLLNKTNTVFLRDTVKQTSLGKSGAGANPRDVCITVSRNHKVFLLYQATGYQQDNAF